MSNKQDSEDEYGEEEEEGEEDTNTEEDSSSDEEIEVEKIIGINSDKCDISELLKFYVKPKDDSYLHCKWFSYYELSELEKGAAIRDNFLRRCKEVTFRRCLHVHNLFLPPFQKYDPEWLVPEMVIGITPEQDQYFIKWTKQPFSECTWEYENLVKCQDLVKIYKKKLANAIPCKTAINPVFKEAEFKVYTKSPKYKKHHELSDYQVDGLNWLRQNYRLNRNNILADEMGLGKTIQALSILTDLQKNCNVSGPFLIITPLSTIENWMREISEWTNLEAIALYGTNEDRQVIIDNCIFHPNRRDRVIFNILVVPINLVTKVLNVLTKIHFHYLIVDEAHRLKNFESRSYKEVSSLQFDHCTFLTGTPVQNDMTELWALLHFLDNKEFPSLANFQERFGETVTAEHVEGIQKAIQPYILRRKKADVNIDIGQKEEIIVEVELTRFQRNMYKSILQENRGALLHEMPGVSLNNIAMQLRKICNHPYTIKSMEDLGIRQYKNRHNIPQSQPLNEKQLCESIIESSGKMIFLDKILPILKGHRVLIFSQMTSILDIIEDYCYWSGYKIERIDGSVVGTDRQERIDRFQNSPDSFIFLLSTKAGGLGLNLTIADTVIIYDSDWNPQNDIQAQSRCHRIGQTMDVNVYRLVTRGTYEDEMFKRASKKLGLDTAILDAKVSEISEEEIEAILEKGALFLLNEDENEIDKFENEDIQQILERRTTSRHSLLGNKSMFSRVVMSHSTDLHDDDESFESTENEEKNQKTSEPNSNETTDTETSNIEQNETNEEINLNGRNIWLELFPDFEDEEEFDRVKKTRKTGDAIWSKDDAADVIKKVINFGWVGLINDEAISQTKVYAKTLAWAAYSAFGKEEKHRYLMKRLIGLAPNEEISSYLISEPFSDIAWFRDQRPTFEKFLKSLNDMLQITRCLTFMSIQDCKFLIPLKLHFNPQEDKNKMTQQPIQPLLNQSEPNVNQNNLEQPKLNQQGLNMINNGEAQLSQVQNDIKTNETQSNQIQQGQNVIDNGEMQINQIQQGKNDISNGETQLNSNATNSDLSESKGDISLDENSEDNPIEIENDYELPNWWTIIDDYSLLFGFYRYGFFDYHSMLLDPHLSFKWRIDLCGEYISPTSEFLMKRKNFIVKFLLNRMGDDFKEDIGEICSLQRWMYRQRKFLTVLQLDSDYIKRIFLYLYLNGAEFQESSLQLNFLKIHQNSSIHFLNQMTSITYITDAIRILLGFSPILRLGFSGRLPRVNPQTLNKLDLSSIDEEFIRNTAEMVCFFIKLRGRLHSIKKLTPEQVPEWTDGPEWWKHCEDDIKLATVVAKYGFGSMTQIATSKESPFYSRFLPFDTHKWIMIERMTLTPFVSMGLRNEAEWLSIPVLHDRLMVLIDLTEQ